jgi:hypothetical protein
MVKSLAILTIVIGSVLATSHSKNNTKAPVKKSQPTESPSAPVAIDPTPKPVVPAQAPAPPPEAQHTLPAINYSGWALVLVGIAVCVVIAQQTSATRKSADAALQQVSMQGEMLRPRLSFAFSSSAYADMVQGKMVVVSVDVVNGGGVPAYEVIPETWIEWLEQPFKFTSAAIYNRGTPIYVDTDKPTTYRVPLTRRLTPTEIAALRDGVATVCLRIKLTYTALGQTGCSEDAFAMEPNGVGVLAKYSRYN